MTDITCEAASTADVGLMHSGLPQCLLGIVKHAAAVVLTQLHYAAAVYRCGFLVQLLLWCRRCRYAGAACCVLITAAYVVHGPAA